MAPLLRISMIYWAEALLDAASGSMIRAYISRREVKVFGVEIFLYEWILTAKFLCGQEISKVKIIYFSK
jgi:hypothetical protein